MLGEAKVQRCQLCLSKAGEGPCGTSPAEAVA